MIVRWISEVPPAMVAALDHSHWRCHLLDDHDRVVRNQLSRYRGQEVRTTGDGFVATFDEPARAIRCGAAIIAGCRPLGLDIRAGLHTGECDLRGNELGGLAFHIAARVGAGPRVGNGGRSRRRIGDRIRRSWRP